MTEAVGMHHIHSLLSRAGVPYNTTSISIVSLIGCKDRGASTQKGQQAFIDAANSIVGEQAFSNSKTVKSLGTLQTLGSRNTANFFILYGTPQKQELSTMVSD
jgi:hypothetical protein